MKHFGSQNVASRANSVGPPPHQQDLGFTGFGPPHQGAEYPPGYREPTYVNAPPRRSDSYRGPVPPGGHGQPGYDTGYAPSTGSHSRRVTPPIWGQNNMPAQGIFFIPIEMAPGFLHTMFPPQAFPVIGGNSNSPSSKKKKKSKKRQGRNRRTSDESKASETNAQPPPSQPPAKAGPPPKQESRAEAMQRRAREQREAKERKKKEDERKRLEREAESKRRREEQQREEAERQKQRELQKHGGRPTNAASAKTAANSATESKVETPADESEEKKNVAEEEKTDSKYKLKKYRIRLGDGHSFVYEFPREPKIPSSVDEVTDEEWQRVTGEHDEWTELYDKHVSKIHSIFVEKLEAQATAQREQEQQFLMQQQYRYYEYCVAAQQAADEGRVLPPYVPLTPPKEEGEIFISWKEISAE